MTNKGGRGKKSLYKTTHARIPENIKPIIDLLSSSYKEYVEESGCLDFDNKNFLPLCSAIYFVISNDEILYVGKSKQLKKRWDSHHLLKDIKELNKTESIQIAWLTCNDASLLTTLERIFISSLEPRLNRDDVCLKNLTPYKNKWKAGKTKTVRVSIKIADYALEAARYLDNIYAWDKEAKTILIEALKLKANSGGAIKIEIKKAMELLELAREEQIKLDNYIKTARNEVHGTTEN